MGLIYLPPIPLRRKENKINLKSDVLSLHQVLFPSAWAGPSYLIIPLKWLGSPSGRLCTLVNPPNSSFQMSRLFRYTSCFTTFIPAGSFTPCEEGAVDILTLARPLASLSGHQLPHMDIDSIFLGEASGVEQFFCLVSTVNVTSFPSRTVHACPMPSQSIKHVHQIFLPIPACMLQNVDYSNFNSKCLIEPVNCQIHQYLKLHN